MMAQVRNEEIAELISVPITSLKVTRSKFEDMVTLRSALAPGGYLGTINTKHWAGMVADINSSLSIERESTVVDGVCNEFSTIQYADTFRNFGSNYNSNYNRAGNLEGIAGGPWEEALFAADKRVNAVWDDGAAATANVGIVTKSRQKPIILNEPSYSSTDHASDEGQRISNVFLTSVMDLSIRDQHFPSDNITSEKKFDNVQLQPRHIASASSAAPSLYIKNLAYVGDRSSSVNNPNQDNKPLSPESQQKREQTRLHRQVNANVTLANYQTESDIEVDLSLLFPTLFSDNNKSDNYDRHLAPLSPSTLRNKKNNSSNNNNMISLSPRSRLAIVGQWFGQGRGLPSEYNSNEEGDMAVSHELEYAEYQLSLAAKANGGYMASGSVERGDAPLSLLLSGQQPTFATRAQPSHIRSIAPMREHVESSKPPDVARFSGARIIKSDNSDLDFSTKPRPPPIAIKPSSRDGLSRANGGSHISIKVHKDIRNENIKEQKKHEKVQNQKQPRHSAVVTHTFYIYFFSIKKKKLLLLQK